MRIRDRLRDLYPTAPSAHPETTDALHDALLARLPAAAPPAPRRPKRRWFVGALAGLTLAAACVMPTDYEMDFGHRIAFSVPMTNADFDPERLAHHVEANFAVDELRVMAQISRSDAEDGSPPQGDFRIALDVVGEVVMDDVEESLLDAFPELEAAGVDVREIDGLVHGTLGGMLSHRTLGWVVDGDSAEEARERILAELAAQGIHAPRRVSVEIEDDTSSGQHKREVRVEIEADHPPVPQ